MSCYLPEERKKEVDTQLSQLREVARRQRWTVVAEYADVLSGRENDRRGFERMLRDVLKGGV